MAGSIERAKQRKICDLLLYGENNSTFRV